MSIEPGDIIKYHRDGDIRLVIAVHSPYEDKSVLQEGQITNAIALGPVDRHWFSWMGFVLRNWYPIACAREVTP